MGQVLSSEVVPPLDDVDELPGVYDPNDGYEEGVEEEHHGLLFDDAIGLAIDVVEAKAFHD